MNTNVGAWSAGLAEWPGFFGLTLCLSSRPPSCRRYSPDCLAEAEGCDFSITDCVDGGNGSDGADGSDGANGVDVEEDDEQEATDADAADTDADSAIPSATDGGSMAMLAAGAVFSVFFMYA